VWSVAARFHFAEADIWGMPVSRLRFWHDGHVRMAEEDRKMFGASGA
jgi:hypothetical protein